MALLFMDGFDTGIVAQKWSTISATSTTSTRFGVGKGASLGFVSPMTKQFTAATKVFAGLAFNPNGNPSYSGNELLAFWGDNGTVRHHFLRISAVGVLELRLGSSTGTVLGTAACANTGWQYIEMSGTIADSGGTITVRLNGVTVITYTGDTKNGGTATLIDQISIGSGSSPALLIDDVYICDNTGTTNNGFLGDVRVQTLMPNGAGSSTQLSPTGGANYANVSEVADSLATYNSSSTAGQRDTYAMGDLAASTGPIYGVQNSIIAWKSDTGTGTLKTALKAGASIYYDSTLALGTSANSYISPIREANPSTATTWTVSDINSAELGVEIV